jgi:hypothetical protein
MYLDKVDGSSFINITSVLYNIVKLRRQTLASRQSPPSSAPLNHAIPTDSDEMGLISANSVFVGL